MAKVKDYVKQYKAFAESKEAFNLDDAIAFIRMIFPNPIRPNIISIISTKWPDYKKLIESGLTELDIKVSLIAGEYPTRHYCSVCGKEIHAYNINKGFPKTCSSSCTLIVTKTKREKTIIDRHGGLGNASKSIKEKATRTNLKKYGAKNVFSSEEIKARIKETNLEKYGVSNVSQSKDIRLLAENTNLKKYGAKNVLSKDSSVRSSIEQTNIKKFGSKCPLKSPEILAKSKATLKEHYGVDNAWKKFDDNGNVSEIYSNMHSKRLKKSYKALFKLQEVEPTFSLEEWTGHHPTKDYKWKCKTCGKEFDWSINGASCLPRCLNCHPYCISTGQQELLDYIKSLYNGEIITNDRKILDGKEIDILIPELNLGFEYNGDYWHSKREKHYHLNKTKLSESNNIHLIHIFEHEWIHKQSIIKNRIRNLLGQEEKVFARKCEIRKIEKETKKSFLDVYHLQGDCVSSVNLGLYHENELIAVMTFGKPRFNKKYEWELLRYAASKNIIGGANKLLTYFERNWNPKSLMSYADRKWSSSLSNVYQRLGFSFVGETDPSYFYSSKNGKILSRFDVFGKNNIKNVLGEKYDETLTESENMAVNGFEKIFDCGNLAFEKIY